jgi:hypothetical protein
MLFPRNKTSPKNKTIAEKDMIQITFPFHSSIAWQQVGIVYFYKLDQFPQSQWVIFKISLISQTIFKKYAFFKK